MPRRTSIAAVLAASALLLTACSGASGAAPSESAASGAVTFEHPSLAGFSLDFKQQPKKIVMDCYAYSSLHEYGIEPAALFGYECDNPFVMGDADISKIPVVGKDGEINIEKLSEIRPDVIVGQGTEKGWQWFDDEVNGQLTRVAPFIPLPGRESKTIDSRIADSRKIADFLGGDVTSDAVKKSDAEYAAAKESVTKAVKGKDLKIMLTSPTKEMLYTGVGFAQGDLLQELGATIIGPDAPKEGNPWGKLAWEQASSYPADILLVEGYTKDFAFSSQLWDALPAVKAKQLGPWSSKGAMTSSNYAAWLNDVAELVSSSKKVA